MELRITIQWTDTAKKSLKKLPKKVRKGLLDKADELIECHDPRTVHKPLVGPLQGYYRITYSRYRAIYKVEEEELASGDTLFHVKVLFVIAGIRKQRDKKDVYKVAEKLVRLALDNDEDAEEEEPD